MRIIDTHTLSRRLTRALLPAHTSGMDANGDRDQNMPRGERRIFDLEQPRTERMPIHPAHKQAGYSYLLHRHHEDEYRPNELGPRSGAAGVIICGEHTGTHIDALCHQADDLTLYGNVAVSEVQTSRGFSRLAAEEIPPIVAPGVLLDVAAKEGVESLEPGHIVTAANLQECCERQGVSVEAGGVALVRTGNGRYWEDERRYLAGPGMDAGASYWLADRGVIAVGADNMAWDAPGLKDPDLGCTLPGHLILLARRGIHIVENLVLEELAAARAYRFDFICAPLKFVGATGSPVRPLAVVSGSM
ncbi:MAG TPA: cyclase family protein [Rubrobacteraceae bacterium]|nr:cyclase family protein [Rubrobacteraceae bacterium]